MLQLKWWRGQLAAAAARRFAGLDGWITPTAALPAPPVADFADPAEALRLTLAITRATQPGNLLGLCSTSTPIHALGSPLPVGLQLLCPAHREAQALAVAQAIEDLLGSPPRPDLTGYVSNGLLK